MSASNREDLSPRVAVKDSSQCFIDRDDRAVTSTALLESSPSLSQQFVSAIEQCKTVRQLEPDVAAKELWDNSYPTLLESKPWLFQSGVKFAKSQVMRLAHPLAVAAQSNAIGPEHLLAAMSYWQFADLRDVLEQGPLVYGEHEHCVYWHDRVCRLKTGKGKSRGNSRNLMRLLFRAYRKNSFVHVDVMRTAFKGLDGIRNNGISKAVGRLREELSVAGLGEIADGIETYKWAEAGSYILRLGQ